MFHDTWELEFLSLPPFKLTPLSPYLHFKNPLLLNPKPEPHTICFYLQGTRVRWFTQMLKPNGLFKTLKRGGSVGSNNGNALGGVFIAPSFALSSHTHLSFG